MSVVWRGVCPQWTWVWVWCVRLPSVHTRFQGSPPQAHPVTLLSPTLTAPQAVPKPSRPTVPWQPPEDPRHLSAPAHLHFLCQEPSLPKIPPRLRPGSPGSEDFISPDILKAAVGLARLPLRDPGAQPPAGCLAPGDVLWLQLGAGGETGSSHSWGRRSHRPRSVAAPQWPGQAGEGAATGSGVGGQARKPCGGEGASGPAQRRRAPG